jgi:dTDP-4-dehydrorhamnose 3,5-epimerase-like enzyme
VTTAHDDALRKLLVREATATGRIDGVVLRALRVNRDPRGTLTELLRVDWPDVYGDEAPFAQVYASTTAPGIARDEDRWHVHQNQTDRFYCLAGRIVVAIAAGRPASSPRDALLLVELAATPDAPAPLLVTIPPGTLHGFVVTSDTPATLLNFPNRLYDPADEGRVPFVEAAVSIDGFGPFSYEAVRRLYG